jgi:hypothetical protein
MTREFWVVGGVFRDTTFARLEDGGAEAYGPFGAYDEALRSWQEHSARTRPLAAARYSIVATAQPQGRAP